MNRVKSGSIANFDTATAEGRAAVAPSQIGEALWRARLRLGLSVEEVASRTGSDTAVVSAIENSDFGRLTKFDSAIATAKAYAKLVRLPQKWVALTLAAELAHQAVTNFPMG